MSIHLKEESSNTAVDLNDGTWNVAATMNFQTEKGRPVEFPLVPTASNNVVNIYISREQTTTLSHLGNGYMLTIRISNTDDTVFIKNQVQVNVTDDL